METRNIEAVRQLRELGFPMPRIRIAIQKLNGKTAKAIADSLDVSRETIAMTIMGKRGHTLVKKSISEAFDVPVDLFFCDMDQKKRPS